MDFDIPGGYFYRERVRERTVFSGTTIFYRVPSTLSRRRLLRLSTLSLVGALPGCTSMLRTGTVTVSIVNGTETPRIVTVEIRRDEEVVWSQTADVPAYREGVGKSAKVRTERALSGVRDGEELDVRAWLPEREGFVSTGVEVSLSDYSTVEWMTIRVIGEGERAYLDISG